MIRREKTKNVVNDNEPLFIVILKSTFTENPNKETAMVLHLEQEEIYYEEFTHWVQLVCKNKVNLRKKIVLRS